MFMTQDGPREEVPFQQAMFYSHAKERESAKQGIYFPVMAPTASWPAVFTS